MSHGKPHPLAGKTVTIANGVTDPIQGAVKAGAEYRVEDWWDRLVGRSWQDMAGNPAVFQYERRIGLRSDVPMDDEVIYGKIGDLGHLVHVSEIDTQFEAAGESQ